MLAAIGRDSMTDLLDAAMPPSIRTPDLPDVPFAASEAQALEELSRIAAKNTVRTSMIGRGYYDTFTPSVILHPLPAGDIAGPTRGAAEFPDDDQRPDRHGRDRCLDAR